MAINPYVPTERYVLPGGAGANNGLSWADAWDITQVAADLATGRRFNFSGTFTLAASLSWSTGGGSGSPIFFRGWDSSQSAVAAAFGSMPIIDGSASNWAVIGGLKQHWSTMRLTRASALSFGAADGSTVDFCEIDNSALTGITGDNNIGVYRSRIHDNGTRGLDLDIGPQVMFNEIYDNGTDGLYLGNNQACYVGFNFVARNGNDGIFGAGDGSTICFNTIDGNGGGGVTITNSGLDPVFIVGNQLTNNATSLETSSLSNIWMDSNNLYGNSPDTLVGNVILEANTTTVDPQYVDIANNNYEIENTDLIGVSVPILGNANIGAWQSNGGGGGGMLVHPGMSGGLRG